MEDSRLKKLLSRIPTWILVAVAIVCISLAFLSNLYIGRWVGILPGVLGMYFSVICLGRAVRADVKKKGWKTELPPWTSY